MERVGTVRVDGKMVDLVIYSTLFQYSSRIGPSYNRTKVLPHMLKLRLQR